MVSWIFTLGSLLFSTTSTVSPFLSLKELGLIDNIVPEPLGGAHRNYHEMARNLKQCLVEELNELDTFDKDGLLERRYERLMSYGYC